MHIPVLLRESIQYLDPKPNENFIDATIGNGGHTAELLKYMGPEGKILGIDWNKKAIMNLRKKFQKEIKEGRMTLVNDNFANMKLIVQGVHFEKISGVIFDLGMSTEELEESGLGFSFQRDEPLFMTYNEDQARKGLNAAQVVNTFKQSTLEDIFRGYGEEKFSRLVAKAIVEYRRKKRILTSRELAGLIQKVMPRYYEHGRIHPATRVFQALRIYVNDELGNLEKGILEAFEVIEPNGRLVVIAYHSLEDRIVKQTFRNFAKSSEGKLLAAKPITPREVEVTRNPRSRSSKLRAIKKI